MSKIKTLSSISLGVLAFSVMAGSTFAAGNASFSVAGGTFTVGSTIQLPVYETSPTNPVNVVESDMVYDANQMQFISVDTSQSAFAGDLAASGGNGAVKVVRYSMTPLTGPAQIAVLSFKVLASSGTGTLNFAPSSHIVSSGQDVWDKNTSGASFIFAPPALTSSPPPSTPAAQPKPSTPPPQSQPLQNPPAPVKDQVLATTARLPRKNSVVVTYPDNSKNWWAFIGLCGLTVIGLVARLFNLHKKIRARSVPIYLLKAFKRAI